MITFFLVLEVITALKTLLLAPNPPPSNLWPILEGTCLTVQEGPGGRGPARYVFQRRLRVAVKRGPKNRLCPDA